MTDIPVQDAAPDVAFEEANALLDSPRDILALALARIQRADDFVLDPAGQFSTTDDDSEDDQFASAVIQNAYRLLSAYALAQVAKAAHDMQAQTRFYADDTVSVTDVQQGSQFSDGTRPPVRPQPTRGIRYRALLTGDLYMGFVGDRRWLFDETYGFLDITNSEDVHTQSGLAYELHGRMVSATPDHALLVDDGGHGHTLPRALLTELTEG